MNEKTLNPMEYNIVLCDDATVVEQTAANELQNHLNKITGITLPIVGENSAQDKSFMVGPTAFAIANGIDPAGSEQWAIKSVDNKIILTGGRQRGTLYAVYHLLEDEIGVRWWNPWEEYIPNLSILTVSDPIEKSGSPAFTYRDIYDGIYDTGISYTGSAPLSLFYVRNRLNGFTSYTPVVYGGTESYGLPYHVHTYSFYLPPDQYYDLHPEYYALAEGEHRRNGQLCVTNDDVKAIFKQKLSEYIAASYAHADANGLDRPVMFALTPGDFYGCCQCPNCTALINNYGTAGYNLLFVNDVAADIEKEYPEVRVETLAYMYYVDPPKGGVVPHSNVQIRYANAEKDMLHSITSISNQFVLDGLQQWKNITTNKMYMWDYGLQYNPNPPIPSMYNLGIDYRQYREMGINGIFLEQEFVETADMWDMKIWMETKYMENPDLDLRATMSDFTGKYYGAAARFIDSYLDRCHDCAEKTSTRVSFEETNIYSYFTLDFVMWAETNFDNAAAAVANDPVLQRRVNDARSSLDRTVLMKWDQFKTEADQRSITLNINRSKTATRYVNTVKIRKSLRSFNGSINDRLKNADDEIVKLTIPSELGKIPYSSMIDIPCEKFTSNSGMAHIEDSDSLIGRCAKIKPAQISDTAFHTRHKPPIKIRLYDSRTFSTRCLKSLDLSEITPDQYQLYKMDSIKISSGDYLYLFKSWPIQINIDSFLAGKPDQMYDMYLSMKFEGPLYGGNSLKMDALYIDRTILVGKGTLPSVLQGNPIGTYADYSPEAFKLYTPVTVLPIREQSEDSPEASKLFAQASVVSIREALDSSVGRAAYVDLTVIANEQDYKNNLPPILISLYNPMDGERCLKNYTITDITPLNQYNLYKVAENIQINPADCLSLFQSKCIQVDLRSACTSDPALLYDIYVSMKFQGPAYGGDKSKDNGAYIDRVIVVRKMPEYGLRKQIFHKI